ncbi:hypothetical protein SPHI_10300 [Sphingomonas jeddahensis]|uniref:Uncharacterized protein n=2 Tax=Sphingomonas jeddahensis TaxID=1915074 RepID=A0A1V2EVX5_9SPHN|nr:hypothetical protein SPHI_10300 [Sphingomonas jeddahensis]
MKSDLAAEAARREPRDESLDVAVPAYGSGHPQKMISMHEPAFNAFVPAAVEMQRATLLILKIPLLSSGGMCAIW